jgi:hypothetical protein
LKGAVEGRGKQALESNDFAGRGETYAMQTQMERRSCRGQRWLGQKTKKGKKARWELEMREDGEDGEDGADAEVGIIILAMGFSRRETLVDVGACVLSLVQLPASLGALGTPDISPASSASSSSRILCQPIPWSSGLERLEHGLESMLLLVMMQDTTTSAPVPHQYHPSVSSNSYLPCRPCCICPATQ